MKKFVLKFLPIICLMIGLCAPIQAQSDPKVLLIDIPRLMTEEITAQQPVLHSLFSEGACGLLTLPDWDTRYPEQIYLRLNSERFQETSEEAINFYQTNEKYNNLPVDEVYRTFTGQDITPGSAVNLGLARLLQLNPDSAQEIGYLGNILHENGKKTAVIGNADLSGRKMHRFWPFLFMDSNGKVDFASIDSKMLTSDKSFVYGVKTDTSRVLKELERYSKQADVIQIMLGDMERIEQFGPYLDPERLAYHRQKVLDYYEQFFAQLLPKIDNQAVLLVVTSLTEPKDLAIESLLYPVVLVGKDFPQGASLYSNSTRRQGLITGYDLTATVLKHVGIDIANYNCQGRPIRAQATTEHDITDLNRRLSINYNVRWTLIGTYAYFLIALSLGFLAFLLFGSAKWEKLYLILEKIYLFCLTIPAVCLIEALFDPISWPLILALTFGIAAVIYLLARLLSGGDSAKMFFIITLVNIATIVVDGCCNGWAELRSFWGYSAVAGARFYGVGNEYLGFFLGAYIVIMVVIAPFLVKHSPICLWIGSTLAALFMCHPSFGANIGGGITAWLGLGITNFLYLKKKLTFKRIFLLLLGMVFLLVLVAFWDYNSGQMSHFGRLIQGIRQEGIGVATSVFIDKIGMNLRMIDYTPLTKILLAVLFAFVLLFKNPPRYFVNMSKKYLPAAKGLQGLFITALIALAVNDSGIVSAATMFVFGLNVVFLLLMTEKTGHGSEDN